MSTEPVQPDPQAVREIARTAMTLAAQRRDDIEMAIFRSGAIGDRPTTGSGASAEMVAWRTAYGALYSAVREEMKTGTATVSWPDEREADVRAVAALLAADSEDVPEAEYAAARTALRERFANQIAALNDNEGDENR